MSVPRAAAVASPRSTFIPTGVHLVGSVPLGSAEEVFRTVSGSIGDRVRRIPDGETGPRADWIVWQYPVLSSQSQFEVAPPTVGSYRALPRLRLRAGESAEDLHLGPLGYAEAARGSYQVFRQLKRHREIPRAVRFQVSLPTPLATVCAFVAHPDQAAVEPVYHAAMMAELEAILAHVPPDQLALQWDTNFEFALLAGDAPAWFPEVEQGILDRLLRICTVIPSDVELGFHFCHGDGKDGVPRTRNTATMVEVANALCASIGRPVNWVHLPAVHDPDDRGFFEPLGEIRLHPETELYVGALDPDEPEMAVEGRTRVLHELVGEFGIATSCGWGRQAPGRVPAILAALLRMSNPVGTARFTAEPGFTWPDGVTRVPGDDWVTKPVEELGLKYDTVENHGWYRNLEPTVARLARDLREGDILVDYSGGTGILLDRLLLRIFDRQVGMMIVDSSQKFLRVALDRFRTEERVAFRLLRYLKDEKRLQRVDEVLGQVLVGRGVDAIVSTNAVHLYYDLEDTFRSWAQILRRGSRAYINSGNLRNPRVGESEWIIDETVYVIHEVASGLVRTDPRYARYRGALDDLPRLAEHLAFRDKVFLAPRPLDYYLDTLRASGFEIEDVTEQTIVADVHEWYEFLSAYHDAVLGWVGGTMRIDGTEPDEQTVKDRLDLIRHALEVIFGGRPTFNCCWTYITARTLDEQLE
jgi:hypothetical protein